jgi:chromosomal replication initiator protein
MSSFNAFEIGDHMPPDTDTRMTKKPVKVLKELQGAKSKRDRSAVPADSGSKGPGSRLDPAVWNRILTHVRLTHPELNRTWFKDLVPRQLDNGSIHVTCQSGSQLSTLTGKCQQPFNAAAQSITNRLNVVTFHCPTVRADEAANGYVNNGPIGRIGDPFQSTPLSPDCTFEHFIVGPDNRLAQAAAIAVATKPGEAYNPLFLHGGVGLGKTHLLQAICQKMLEAQPDLRILYLSCDAFINQFLSSVESGNMNDFRNRFRGADTLIIDDIHFLQGRDRTQEEFFHTFNTLQQQRKQIILSSDAAPSEIPELASRLVSRFMSGLVTVVEKPCFETRVAILRSKAKLRGLVIDETVLDYIARRVDANTRELEGALNKVQSFSRLPLNGHVAGEPQPITLDLTKSALGDSPRARRDKRLTIDVIIDAVCAYYGVKIGELQGKRRPRSIVVPRQVSMYLARKHTHYSLEEIGGYFGGRDHTTVLHAQRQITNLVETKNEVVDHIAAIEERLGLK